MDLQNTGVPMNFLEIVGLIALILCGLVVLRFGILCLSFIYISRSDHDRFSKF